ncbi:hypothetical protein N9B94_04630 [Verrucomicrobia bacterium]|nr:hypothetical protein [Verrucomicrobiota bacterium]MDB4459072.1 hypothetical protein [bacterium]
METQQGLREHRWGYVHFFKDGEFNVSLVDDPTDDPVEIEGRQKVAIGGVEDWQIRQTDGNIRGAYRMMTLFEHREREGRQLSPLMKLEKAELLDFR